MSTDNEIRDDEIGAGGVPMSILKNPYKKLSEQTVKEYALSQGGKFAAIYNQLVSVQKVGDAAKQIANENEETL